MGLPTTSNYPQGPRNLNQPIRSFAGKRTHEGRNFGLAQNRPGMRGRTNSVSVRAMRTLTKYTTFSTPNDSINIALINDALAEIELLEPGENLSYLKIANKYSV